MKVETSLAACLCKICLISVHGTILGRQDRSVSTFVLKANFTKLNEREAKVSKSTQLPFYEAACLEGTMGKKKKNHKIKNRNLVYTSNFILSTPVKVYLRT